MNIQPLISGITCLFLAHVMAFFQLNSQFKWGWFKEHEWVMALMGIPISFLYIWGTKYTVQSFDGLLWPARFVGFAIGIVIYAIFVELFFKEGINTKTFISLILSFILICIQIFWKIK